MKALILSCTMGQGHNSAGRAVYEEFLRREVPCEFTDMLTLMGSRVARSVSLAYTSIATRTPRVFQLIYKTGGFISSPKRKSPVYLANELCQDRLYDYITQNGFDTIIMPHLFPAETLTCLTKKRGLRVKTVAVATDYTCIPFWEETEPDCFVIPHADVADEFVKKGIPREKLKPFGIPVSACFAEHIDRQEARKRLNLPLDKDTLLIMSGSMGFGNLTALVNALYEKYHEQVSIVVLGGTNEKLKAELRLANAARKNVTVVDFTREVSLYMDASDLMFTKPGGLTSTEAAVKNIPTILTPPIPGCETMNAQFFEKHNLAAVPRTIGEQLVYVDWMLSDSGYRARMIEAQRAVIRADAAGAICDFVMQ